MVARNFELWRKFVKEASTALMPLINFFCAIHVTRTYALDVASIPGPSMLPTLNISGDIVLVDRISHRFSRIVPGDIVIVVSPENPRKLITRRLISVGDDTVTYVADPKNSEECKTIVVPKGHLWVQGDNIYASRDSRHFGTAPYGLLYGKVFWRIWPIKHFGSL